MSSLTSSKRVAHLPDTQSSYEDVMNATISTINIFKSPNPRRITIDNTPSLYKTPGTIDSTPSLYKTPGLITTDSSSSLYKTAESNSDETPRSVTESFDENILTNSSESERNFDIEFKKSIKNIKRANEIYYNLKKILNKEKKNDIVTVINDFAIDVIHPPELSNKVEKMNSVLSHIQNIVAKKSKLKEVLMSNVFKDHWHIKREHHKSVVNFFALASELVKNVHSIITALESKKELNNTEVQLLFKREMEFQELLHAYMHNLEELHCFVEQKGMD